VRYIQQTFQKEVSFFDWLLIGGPFTLVFLPLAWLMVTRVLFRSDIGEIAGGRQYFDVEYRKLGPLTRGEKTVLAVFAVTASLWIFSPLLRGMSLGGMKPLSALSDAIIAMLAAMALFLIPVDRARGVRAMDWDTAVKLPWGVLMLFGGGLTLAAAVEDERRVGVHRQRDAGPRRAASPAADRGDHDHHGFPVGAHLQHGTGGDHGARARRDGARARRESLRADHRVHARCEHRLHDAGGNPAERDRLRHGAGADAADDEGRASG
jgi:hypothetical protein